MSQKPRVTTCGIENQAEFRQRLRAHPDIHAFAAALYQAGMLDGLAGARLAEGGTLPSDGVQPVLNLEAEQRLAKRKGAR